MKGKRVKSKKTGRPGWLYRFNDPYTGRRSKKTFFYSEELVADQAFQKMLDERQKLRDGIPSNAALQMEYVALVGKFVTEAPITSEKRRSDLKKLLERNPLRVNRVAELFDRGRLTAACRKLFEAGNKRCCFRTAQAPLKQLTAWAASIDLLQYDPLQAWKKLPWRRTFKRTTAISADHLRLILQALLEMDEVYRRKFSSLAPVLTLLLTGNRNSAIYRASIADLKADRVALPEGNGKKRNGAATLPAEFVEILRRYLEHRNAKNNDARLLVSYAGTEIDLTNILKDFKRAMILAAVRLHWPKKAEYSEVEPIAVAYRLHCGELPGHEGAPAKKAAKIEARRRRDTLVETVAREIESDVRKWCAQKTLYSLRKTHITWARQLVSADAVRVQVGHAPRDVEEKHYLDESMVKPSKSSQAVWDVLLGRLSLDGVKHELCFEVAWREGRLFVGPVKSGPNVAPDAEKTKTEPKKISFLQRQNVGVASVVKKPSPGIEPGTYGLQNRCSTS